MQKRTSHPFVPFAIVLALLIFLGATAAVVLRAASPAEPAPQTRATIAPAPTSAPLTAPPKTARAATEAGLPNFATVEPGIYRGAAPTPEGMRALKAMGVQTIIDLRIERKGQAEEAALAQQLGFERLRIPMGSEAPTKKQVSTFLATLDNPAKQPVFVHCQHGADRTGAMIGIYRTTKQGWDFDRTYAEMQKYGFKPFLHELKGSVEAAAAKK